MATKYIVNNVPGQTINGDLTTNTISATTYYNVSSNFQYEIHVSQIDGNDTTGDGSLLNPVATITKALTLLTVSRKTITVHPGGYNENITVADGNTTIQTSELTGANTLLYGTLTIGTLGSGSRISGLKMTNLVISGTAQAYISNCTVDNQVTKSSSGYVEIINTEMQCISGITISGAGIIIINGNKNVGVSVSNASAQVIIKGCNSVVTPSASAGNLAIVDCIVTALGGNAITITNSATTLTLLNSQVLVQAGNNVAPISVAGIYSIINTIYDKPNSSITGTNTNSIDYFQFINADKFITQGGTSLQYVMGDGSLSNGFTGGTVTGATNFTSGLTANIISANTITITDNIDSTNRQLLDENGFASVVYTSQRTLEDLFGTSLDWGGKYLYKSDASISFDWENGILTGQTNIESATISATTLYGDGSNLTGISGISPTTGSWTLSAGTNTVSFTVTAGQSYVMWVNGNIPNGIVNWNATVTLSNTNVPAIGVQYGWWYDPSPSTTGTLVLTAIPNQIVGTAGGINTTSYLGSTSNVFTFDITNNSGSSQIVYYGYVKIS